MDVTGDVVMTTLTRTSEERFQQLVGSVTPGTKVVGKQQTNIHCYIFNFCDIDTVHVDIVLTIHWWSILQSSDPVLRKQRPQTLLL